MICTIYIGFRVLLTNSSKYLWRKIIMYKEYLEAVGERIDQLISLDVPSRNVVSTLYNFAREKSENALCMQAAKLLKQKVKPGDVVFIATGWPDRPHIAPEIAETDGPPGAAALARALHRGLGAIPIIFIESNLVKGMEKVLQAAGFRTLSPDQAIACFSSHAPIHGGAVLSFPCDVEEAKVYAEQLVNTYRPSAVIAIEKGGMNDKGKIHTSRGAETTDTMAKADYLILEAKKIGAATIGIGDGGNEIGMGVIEEEIKKAIKYGAKCNCGCGGGIAPSTVTDVLVVAAISNWGAYGVAACLAAIERRIDVLHDASIEKRLLVEAGNASFIDGITGWVDYSADGLGLVIHQSFVTLLNEIVKQAMNSFKVL
jgi:hypothetical protein